MSASYKRKIIFEYIKLILCFPIGLFLYCFRKIYIVSERGTDARDNGYHMFKYYINNHPETDIYYIIDKNSPDRVKVESIGRVIDYGSFKHYVFFVAARVKISTHVMGYAPGEKYYFERFHRYFRIPGKHIFLQHGVIKENIRALHADNTDVDIFICGAKTEYEYIKEIFGYPKGVVQYTGLARYDNLHGHVPKNQILVMPTWRSYISGKTKEEFCKTDFYMHWNSFLNSAELSRLLRENNLKLYFYPHYEMQKYADCFCIEDSNIIIAKFSDFDVQQLLIDSKLLITDYSSVYFDFAYMRKPLIYYQFDREQYNANHYSKGYFDFYTIGFGDVSENENDLISSLKHTVSNNFIIEEKYKENMKSFFELYDTDNCERIYRVIEEVK